MPQGEEDGERKTKGPERSGWLTTPPGIKRLFDKFPQVTYPANELPQRRRIERQRNRLYVFAREGDARYGEPSFNPGCLKWQ
ncbi:MAG: hypothetical protein Q9183_004378, partial [Haloplaca sp. 2 TL-2023]